MDDLRKKWRGLRDTFGRELKKIINKKSGQATEEDSKWPYFRLLMFLRGTMARRELKSSVPDESFEEEVSELLISNEESYPPSKPDENGGRRKSPKKVQKRRQASENIDNRLLQIEEEKLRLYQESANDPDAQFLLSLLPFLKEVPKHRKLLVRSQLQQVLINEQCNTSPEFDEPLPYVIEFNTNSV